MCSLICPGQTNPQDCQNNFCNKSDPWKNICQYFLAFLIWPINWSSNFFSHINSIIPAHFSVSPIPFVFPVAFCHPISFDHRMIYYKDIWFLDLPWHSKVHLQGVQEKLCFFHNSLQPFPRLHRCKRPSKLSTQCECTVTPIGW